MVFLAKWEDIQARSDGLFSHTSNIWVNRHIYHAYDYPPHRHEYTELVIIAGGCGSHIVEGEEYPVATGDVFVLQGNQTHSFRQVREIDLTNIALRPGCTLIPDSELCRLPGYHALFLLEPQNRQRHKFQSKLHLTPDQLTEVMHIVDRMTAELEQKTIGYEAALLAYYIQVVLLLSRCYSQASQPISRYLLRLGKVISVLEAEYVRPITLGELAEIAHMSINNLLRVFKQATGQSPIDYLMRLRVTRSAELLQNSDQSITDIALHVGFSDTNQFCRQFKRRYGVTPREYRRSTTIVSP